MNNLIKGKTCFNADSGTPVDVMVTNRPISFHKTSIIGTGFSYNLNMILFSFQTNIERLKSKKLDHRDYKIFDKSKFLFELDQVLLKG